MSDNPVTYCIYRSSHTQLMTVICVQPFDMVDYQEHRFYHDMNKIRHWDDESDAVLFLNDHWPAEQIEPRDRDGQPPRGDPHLDGGLDGLIKALQIFRKYGNPVCPTHCEHDVLSVMIDPADVSEEDKAALDRLHFGLGEYSHCFSSFYYGSA